MANFSVINNFRSYRILLIQKFITLKINANYEKSHTVADLLTCHVHAYVSWN